MSIEKMKMYYQMGLWARERLERLLEAGKISREEFDYIVESVVDGA